MNKEEKLYRLLQKLDDLLIKQNNASSLEELNDLHDQIDFLEYEIYELENENKTSNI